MEDNNGIARKHSRIYFFFVNMYIYIKMYLVYNLNEILQFIHNYFNFNLLFLSGTSPINYS